jgi:transcriptional regulator GlxA family with amidase domain
MLPTIPRLTPHLTGQESLRSGRAGTTAFGTAPVTPKLNVSPRHLTRLFHDELPTTPARYVKSIRFDMAGSLLDQGHTATHAATLAGFPGYESLRRVFARELSISPAAYQRRFSTARRANAEQR